MKLNVMILVGIMIIFLLVVGGVQSIPIHVPTPTTTCDYMTTEDSMGFCNPNPAPTQWVKPTTTFLCREHLAVR